MSLENNGNLISQLQEVLQTSTQLENELGLEKKKNKKIAQEYIQVRAQLEDIVKKMRLELSRKDQEITSQQKIIEGLKASEARTLQQIHQVAGQLQIAKGVSHEQSLIVTQLRNQSKDFISLQGRNQELERAVDALAATNRALKQVQLDRTQEIQTLTLNLKAQYQAHFVKEANRIKESVQAEARIEVKKAKTRLDRDLKIEMDRMASTIQIGNQKAQDQVNQATSELKIALQSQERYRARLVDAQNEILNQKSLVAHAEIIMEKTESAHLETQAALQEMRTSLHEQDQTFSMVRLEKQKAQTHAEEFIRDSSKAQLIERLKYEAEIASLKARLESLERARVLIEKIEGPIDAPILMAEPDQEIRH